MWSVSVLLRSLYHSKSRLEFMTPRVRGSAKRLNKTADSGKKNTLQEDEERKHKTSQNQAREASVRMIKHRSDAYADNLERVHDGGNLG